MDNRKFEADAIASPPTAPASPSSGYPTNGDPGAGQNATEPGAWWFHAIGEEIREVIEAAGLTPDHADLTQLRVAIDALIAANIVTVPDASETVKGKVELATDIEAQDGTANKFIDGAKLRSGLNAAGAAPIYACRAWVNFNGTGTPAIRASGNVSSITDNGAGNYTVNLTTAMPDANYSVEASVSRDVAFLVSSAIASLKSSSFVVESLRESNSGPTAQDPTYVTAAVFR